MRRRRLPLASTALGICALLFLPTSPATAATETTADVSTIVSDDFETSTGGWAGRGATVALTDAAAHTGTSSLAVTDRANTWSGAALDVSSLFSGGVEYTVSAWVRLADAAAQPIGVNLGANVPGAANEYPWVGGRQTVGATDWVQLTGTFTNDAAHPAATLYIEAASAGVDLLLDDVLITASGDAPEPEADLSLTPLKDTVDFPVGVAIDQRETTGAASDLLLHHFDQITPENHMKVEAWYDAEKNFVPNPQAAALLDYSAAHDLRLYGHVLAWHSQTPDWFFQDDTGRELTATDADKQLLRDRLRTHIFDIAEWISSEYGAFGSATNPLVAWDVVNEVISDQATTDGLRPSRWYQVLGEEYIHLAFQYADEAFNGTYAVAGTDRPVKLFINDYNTEQSLKGEQYHALVQRLLDAGVPIDGVGHQFHVSITTPLSSLQQALDRFAGMGLAQAVTELDVTLNPANEANRIAQGHFYRDVFDLLRDYDGAAPTAEKLFSVTVWGLTDARSWRDEQQPLLFDGTLGAKPAYFGAAGDDDGVPPLVKTSSVFEGDVALDDGFADAVEWRNVPENALTQSAGGFRLRWNADHLTVLLRTSAAIDRVEFSYAGGEAFYAPGVDGSVAGVETTVGSDRFIAVHLPHTGVTRGASGQFDLRLLAGGETVSSWNSAGALGSLTFLEPLSALEAAAAASAPTVDAVIDDSWAAIAPVTTATTVEGSAEGATASVRTQWHGDTLYALFEVTDAQIDATASDPWNRDGVELFLDLENRKTGAYGPNDAQFRVTVDNEQSFGTGNADAQRARLTSATARTGTGYIVEMAIALTGQSGGQNDVPLGGADTFHGIDFQVNDGRDGARFAVHTWADPTGTGYQTTARWGVVHLAAAPVELAASRTIGWAQSPLTTTRTQLKYSVIVSSDVTPTGTVEVRDGDQVIATITLDERGRGSVKLPKLTRGVHTLSAHYTGDGAVDDSSSRVSWVLVL